MASNFDRAFQYVIENEGAYSNDSGDRGGETFWGISAFAREKHRCPQHMGGVKAGDFAGPGGRELAQHIYRTDFWKFDGIRDARLAIKLFDITVNVGNAVRVIQRAAMVKMDGKYGPVTEAAILRLPTEEAIERLCQSVADEYVEIVRKDPSQLKFLKGWMRRAVRRPPVIIAA